MSKHFVTITPLPGTTTSEVDIHTPTGKTWLCELRQLGGGVGYEAKHHNVTVADWTLNGAIAGLITRISQNLTDVKAVAA